MNEIQVLLESYKALRSDAKQAALATIVKVKGSAYRRPGARMLITADGRTVGSISAGCLDRDVCEHAHKVVASGTPIVTTYDTTAAGDDVWGLGLGCAGLVDVLIEPLGKGTPGGLVLTFLGERLARRDVGAVVTVFRVLGPAHAEVGSRLMLTGTDRPRCIIENPHLARMLTDEARQALREGRSRVKEFGLQGGTVEALIEVIQPPISLAIYGAGDDAIPLARLAKEIGWRVTVVDYRPGYATSDRFPSADAVVVVRPGEAAARVPMDGRTAAVILTHNYANDLELLRMLLQSPVRYVGVLGARNRTAAMLRALHESGVTVGASDLVKVYSPVGADIGAETPEEIALSILAEIKAVSTGRTSGFLRDRKGPIHEDIGAADFPIGSTGVDATPTPAAGPSHDG